MCEQKGWDRGVVGEVTHRVTCTWWLLWQVIEVAWLGLGGPVIALIAQKMLPSSCRSLISGSECILESELAENADY